MSDIQYSAAAKAAQAAAAAPVGRSKKEWALAHAADGWHVFPCHEVLPDGRCSCGKPDCSRKGKHPRTRNGLKDATPDLAQVERWWTLWPDANIGGRTGAASGRGALDEDPRHGGDASLAELEAKNGALPTTLTAITGGGGRHYIFRTPTEGFPTSTGTLAPGLDTRGDGGYILLAGSNHVAGGVYAWVDPDVPLADPPAWLVEGAKRKAGAKPSGGRAAAPAPAAEAEVVREGGRNDTLASEAGKLRRIGLAEEEIEAALLVMNERRCRPPLPDDEVRGIARSIGRYEPARLYERTEFGVAERFLDDLDGSAVWCEALGKWLVWDGRRWAVDGSQEVPKRAKQTIKSLLPEAEALADDDERKQGALAFAYKMQEARRWRAILDLAKPHVTVDAGRFDQDGYLLNVLNGTIDLRTGKLRPHEPGDMLRKIIPIAYDPKARCPIFHRFMLRIMGGDKGMVRFLQRLFGYALLGITNKQEMAVFHGTGRNGKSTLVEFMRDMFGDYGARASADMFMERRQESIPHDLAGLVGVRLVAASETRDGGRLDAGRIKAVLGGEAVKVRFLYKDLFDLHPVFTPILSTNHRPIIDGNDFGIVRRLLLVLFGVTIPEEEVDAELPKKLRAEKPGVLAWLVRGALEYQRVGLCPPAKVTDATKDYRDEMDTLGLFLAEKVVFADQEGGNKKGGKTEWRISTNDLYAGYRIWCGMGKIEAVSLPRFGRKLAAYMRDKPGVESSTVNGRSVWKGFALRDRVGGR